MSATALVPLAMFLINETTRDIYVMPAEAAARIDGIKPCASIRLNIVATEFSAASLDQMCVLLAQNMLPRVNAVVKTTWSSEHAARIAGTMRALGTLSPLRRDPQVWPPDVPFTVSGLSAPEGLSVVFGVRTVEKGPSILERVDVWSQLEGRFLRSYWSRAIQDPTNAMPLAKIMQRVGATLQRSWKAPTAPQPSQESLRLMVDKKISERELSVLENVVKSFSKGPSEIQLIPLDVRKEGIVYQTRITKAKAQDVVAKLNRDLPALRAQLTGEGPVDINLVLTVTR